jgi:predicted Rossmann fold flavoprotein
VVIGAGAAGLLAAGSAARAGASVVLLEKMDVPARKLRITGKGRCNLSNVAPVPEFIGHFGPNGRFLRQAFHRFFTPDLVELLEGEGVPTVVERGGRVFPAGDDARAVVRALVDWAQGAGVRVVTQSAVSAIGHAGNLVNGVLVSERANRNAGRTIPAERVIVATGGASYPATGSTGDGYRLAQAAGHTVVPVRPALVPLVTAGDVARRLQGLSLRNVGVRLEADGSAVAEGFGEMLFTHFGLSGPTILTLSKHAVDALRRGSTVTISIDLKPALDEQKLDARLLREIEARNRQHARRLLKALLPAKLVPVCADLVGLPLQTPCHAVTAEQRGRLRSWLKGFGLVVTDHRPLSEAIITAGGVDLREIDPYTMESRRAKGLYFAGEVLDIDADTGGYNLQAAFSTGWVAGLSAAA